MREEIARVIDPDEWALQDFGKNPDFRPGYEVFLRSSLAKADAILALLHSTPVAGGEGSADEWTFDRDKYAAEIKEFLDEHFAGSSGSDRASHPARIDGAPREAIAKLEEALRPFALMADRFIYLDDEQLVHLHTSKGAANPMVPNTVGDFRRAQAALLSDASEESQDGPPARPLGSPQSQPGTDAPPRVHPAPSRLEVISALVGAFHKRGGMAAAETGMVNVEGYMADAVMALYGDVPSGSANRAMIKARPQP